MGCGASSAATDNPTAGYQPSADPAMDPAGQVVQGFSKELQSRGKADHAADDNKKYGDGAAQFVYRDCLTGGPCGGKSSSQDALSAALKKAGYNVYFAPEVPTILMNGARQPCRHHTARTLTITLSLPPSLAPARSAVGCRTGSFILVRAAGGCVYPGMEEDKRGALEAFEAGIIKMQLQMERSFVGIAASTGSPSVVIFDRGLLDIPSVPQPALRLPPSLM